MDTSILAAAGDALVSLSDPVRLGYLALGVMIGLTLGVIPGLSGLIGLSLLLPFTYSMEPLAGLAMLIGLAAVTTTSDTIPAVLFGVPGTVGSAATTLDGHPLAKRGEASRAFGAAFFASMLGGLFGAVLLGLSVPVLRPLVLMVGTPDLLAFCIFGLSLVAVLSGGNAFKGLAAACLGLVFAMIGEDSQAGEMRWTFGSIYLWDGMQIVPLALGLFAIPELADLMIRRSAIVSEHFRDKVSSQREGVMDVLRNKFLVVRCASIGALLGAVPGIGAAVIDWIAYAHAARTIKGADKTFGTGDIRGVIASESSNNAKEGGSLVPTIAFGVPGSASMALILAAFTVHGIVPGPRMLSTNLDITYALVWSIAIANVLGAGVCFLFAGQLAKLALLRASILVPIVLAVSFIGAFQGQRAWGDLYLLVAAGVLGFVMKRLGWPRPPVILAFVLGSLLERYMFISTLRYGGDWLMRPLVLIILALALYGVFAPTLRSAIAAWRGKRNVSLSFGFGLHRPPLDVAFTGGLFVLFAATLVTSAGWDFGARLFPQVIGWTGLVATGVLLFAMLFVRMERTAPAAHGEATLDVRDDLGDLGAAVMWRRALVFFAWCVGYLVAAALIGMLPAMVVFLFAYLVTAGERLWLAAALTLGIGAASYGLFHYVLVVPWPDAVLGDLFPALRDWRPTRLF